MEEKAFKSDHRRRHFLWYKLQSSSSALLFDKTKIFNRERTICFLRLRICFLLNLARKGMLRLPLSAGPFSAVPTLV